MGPDLTVWVEIAVADFGSPALEDLDVVDVWSITELDGALFPDTDDIEHFVGRKVQEVAIVVRRETHDFTDSGFWLSLKEVLVRLSSRVSEQRGKIVGKDEGAVVGGIGVAVSTWGAGTERTFRVESWKCWLLDLLSFSRPRTGHALWRKEDPLPV